MKVIELTEAQLKALRSANAFDRFYCTEDVGVPLVKMKFAERRSPLHGKEFTITAAGRAWLDARSEVEALIDRSSLGTPAAKAIRSRAHAETVKKVLKRADEIAAKRKR